MKLLDTKEKKFVQAKLSGLDNTKAAIAAGCPPASARQQGYMFMKRPQVREALGITLEQLGISFEKAIKPIKEALEATKIVVHGTDPETGWTDEIPDYPTRLKAAAMALKLITDEYKANEEKPHVAKYQLTDETNKTIDLNNMDEVELQRAVFRKLEG